MLFIKRYRDYIRIKYKILINSINSIHCNVVSDSFVYTLMRNNMTACRIQIANILLRNVYNIYTIAAINLNKFYRMKIIFTIECCIVDEITIFDNHIRSICFQSCRSAKATFLKEVMAAGVVVFENTV